MWKVKMGDVHHAPKAKVAATLAVANANSNANSTNPLMKKPKDRVPVKISLTEINQYLMCQLCSGYLIDATAIIECQHTFCKSCILKYLETNSYCPICDVQLNKAKPHLSLRERAHRAYYEDDGLRMRWLKEMIEDQLNPQLSVSSVADAILQKLVYKTVPGLFVSEIRRRKDFARKFPSDSPAGTLVELDEAEDLCVLSPDDAVSLSLEYFKSDEDSNEQKQTQQQSQQQQKQQALQSQKKSTCSDKANDRRYLQCPAAVSVGLLKKFIRMKYGLLDDYRVDLLYNGDRDSNLENDLTLLDLAFIFKWNKDEPMCFHYRIFDRPVKSVSPRPGTKRPAPSMMDEPPPDDDAASGPPNRSSMASASPSKLPRISESGTNSNNTSNSTSTNSSNNSCSSASHSSSSPSSSSLASPEGAPSASSSASASDSPKKTSKGHSSHKSNHKTKGKAHSAAADEIPCSTMSRRSMSANNTNNTNSPNTRGRTNSSSKKEQQEESKSKYSVNASGTNKVHKQPSVTTKLNNGSVKLSISTACLNVPPRNASPPRERLKISLGSIAKEKSSHNHHSHEKRHHHHHHRRHKLKKEKNREKKDKKSKDRDKDKSKHGSKLKLSLNLNNLTASSCSSSSSSNSHLNNNSNSNSSSTTSSSNNHNQSQNQSQQFSSGKDGKQGTSQGNEKESSGKGKQQTNGNSNAGNRVTSSSHAQIGVNVNTSNGSQSTSNVNQSQNQGGKIKTLTNAGIISKNSGLDIQPANNSSSPSSSSARTSGNNHHPLLPDSVQVPKSVTLIPVNPNAPNSSKITNNSSRGGDKTSGRLNSHTFTHPITNKSLHQITVTEVPPPQQKPNCPSNNPTNNTGSSSTTNNATSSTGANQTTGGSSSLEKAIVNATTGTNANKPQFSGPGSMEITKIYSSPAGSKVFDSATAKKLKERKGLDISISGTSLSVVKPTANTREENYRQNISTGGIGQQSNSVANTNKAKSAAAALLSGKMPPGITIGPANAMASNNSRQNDPSKGGLTFTIPHHLGTTSIPGNLPALRNIGTKLTEKNGKKDSNSGNGKPVRTPPPPTTTAPPPQIQQQQQPRKLGENLSSKFDTRASPSPPKEKNSSAKEQTSNSAQGNNSKGFKRSFDAGSLNRKNHLSLASPSAQNQRESPGPERKRDRSNSSSGSRSSSSAAADHDSPLDLSGKSSRSEHTSSSKSDISFPKGGNRPPTPVPKSVSPLQTSSTTGKSSSKESASSYHQTNKSNSSAAKPLNPNSNAAQQNQTILSIAQSLHQKQQQQQQQQQQQNQFLQHALGLGQNNQKSNSSSSARTSPHIANSLGNQSNSMSSSNSGSNSNISGNPLDSLSSQMIPLSTPSPPNTAGFNSLRMLADATLLHKMHPMNSLMAVAGMCSQGVPPLSLSNAAASVGNQLSPGMFGQTPSGGMNSGKPMGPPHGLLDPSHHNIFAALQNQSINNGRVGLSGMVGNPFGSSLSPPLYYPGNSVRPAAQLPPPTGPSLRIPNVTPKLSSSGGKSPSSMNPPISMTPPHLYPSLSPNSNSNSKAKSSSPSPPSGATPSNPSTIMSSVLNSNQPSRSSNNNSMSNSFNQSGNHRNQKINGVHSSVPIIPPGVHNPLLPSRISSSSTSSSHNYLSAALASTASKASSALAANSNNGKSSPNLSSPASQSSSSKSGIPASMKISNFLPPPNKSVASSPYNANAQATITSSSSISSSLARFLNSLPPLLSPSQQQVSQHSLSLLPPFSVPSTKVDSSANSSKPLTTESNAKSVGKSHSAVKIGFGASSDRKDTKGKDETIGVSTATSSLSTSTHKGKIASGGTSTSNATGFGAPLNLNMSHGLPGLGSPPSSSRITQPQSQAVRHIPNPCLLFNRQNSGGNNNVNINVNPPSSITPTMTLNSFIPPINNDSQHDSTNTNTTADGKKSPIRVPMPMPPTILPSPTMPLQTQVAGHSMLSLFPGVSVPLKVEVPAEAREKKEELPLRSSSPPPSPVVPPVKKVEIIEREISPTILPLTVPTIKLQPSVKPIIPKITPSQEKIVKEETLNVRPSQTENNKQEVVSSRSEKITENCINQNENKSGEESIKINHKVEHDNANHKVEKQLQSPSLEDKKGDLERKDGNKDNEQIRLENGDNSTAEVDNEDVDIVDVVSVDVIEEETEKLVVVVGENEEADKKTTDVAVNILDRDTIAEKVQVKSLELEDVKELDENSHSDKIVSKIEKGSVVEGCKDEEEKIPVILTGTDSKEIVTGDKLELSEPKIELDVDMVDEVKTEVVNEMGSKCEELESVSESAMEIDVEGDDGEIELDVGVDEPMEVPLQGILQSLNSDENSQSVLPNDNEIHSQETTTVSPHFIQNDSEVTNNCSDTPIISKSNEDIPENKLNNIPCGLESLDEASPEKKMKFSEDIEIINPLVVNEAVLCETKVEEKEEEAMEIDVDVCDEGSEINSEDNSAAITKEEFPVEVSPVEIVSAVVTVLPCDMKTEENESKVNNTDVSELMPEESVVCESTEKTVGNEEFECKLEVEDKNPEKVEVPVGFVDNETAAGAEEEECKTELVECDSSLEKEIREDNLENAIVEKEKCQELNSSTGMESSSTEIITSSDAIVAEPLAEEKSEFKPSLVAIDYSSDNEDGLESNCEENPDLAVNNSQNIIQMSESSLRTEETPTVIPSDTNSALSVPAPDPLTMPSVSLPTETGEEAIKVVEEPEPVESTNEKEVLIQQQPEIVPENCTNETESKTDTDTQVSITIPGQGDEIISKNDDGETEASRNLSMSSPNSDADGSSSSLSSPSSLVGIVGVGVQRVNLKKMENLEKVAAGLLATANMNMGSININNNNNSLAPASCDITISAANQC